MFSGLDEQVQVCGVGNITDMLQCTLGFISILYRPMSHLKIFIQGQKTTLKYSLSVAAPGFTQCVCYMILLKDF